MNKNGMTMIEVMAAIAILAVLTTISVPAFSAIRASVLKSSLTSTLNNVKTAALEYADNDINNVPSYITSDCTPAEGADYSNTTTCLNECRRVTVRTLIEENYIAGDDAEKISLSNPVNGESLNNVVVCVKYNKNTLNDRKLVAYIVNESALYD